MKAVPLAGKPVQAAMLVNVPKLITAYYTEILDPSVLGQRVAYGTSGHRGCALEKSFNEWHVVAINEALGFLISLGLPYRLVPSNLENQDSQLVSEEVVLRRTRQVAQPVTANMDAKEGK